jgi:DNA polymerase eta
MPSLLTTMLPGASFYCEVERRQHPELVGVPMAVVQYNPFENEDHSVLSHRAEEDRTDNASNGSIIAVSYEARAAGVTRSMRGREARSVCPKIQLVQVPTANAKADLELYRDAGAKVLEIFIKGGTCERASVDEAYVDCTSGARKRLAAARQMGDDGVREMLQRAAAASAGGSDPGSHISCAAAESGTSKAANELSRDDVRSGHSQQGAAATTRTADTLNWWARPLSGTDELGGPCWAEGELMLAAGAIVVAELRSKVRVQLGYSCSAGIAHNKILAKLCAGLHKPNQQTLLPMDSVSGNFCDSLQDTSCVRMR